MRLTQTLTTSAAALMLALSLTGCQIATQSLQDGIDQAQAPDAAAPGATSALTATLIRVVDGDTITVVPDANFPATNDSGSEHTIRMLGIDTPELNKMSGKAPECGAQEAANYLGDVLHASDHNVQLTVTFDARADHNDRFGRSLAYVGLADGPGGDANLSMVADGFAEAWYPWGEPEPKRYSNYKDAQLAAEASNAGQHAFCDTIGR